MLLFEPIKGRTDLEVAGHLGINHCSQTATNTKLLLVLAKFILDIEGIFDELIELAVPDFVEHPLDSTTGERNSLSPRLVPERTIRNPPFDEHAAELIDQCTVGLVAAARLDLRERWDRQTMLRGERP
jgi:hypothetical protein